MKVGHELPAETAGLTDAAEGLEDNVEVKRNVTDAEGRLPKEGRPVGLRGVSAVVEPLSKAPTLILTVAFGQTVLTS